MYKPLENIPYGKSLGPGKGSPLMLFKCANELRLGYEIIKLMENPTTNTSLKISGRDDAGIGIDSDLPKVIFPKEVLARLGDYHKWSTLHKYNWPAGVITKDLSLIDIIDRVRIMFTDELFAEGDRLISQARVHPVSGDIVKVETPSPALELAKLGRFQYVTSDEKLQAVQDPKWREYAKIAARVGAEQMSIVLQQNREKALEELADISAGKPVIETAVPRFDAIERLLHSYIEQMSAKY